MHAIDLMPLASKNVHSMPLLLHTEKRFLVLFVHYLFLDNVVFHALRSFDIFFVRLQDRVHFRSQTHTLCYGGSGTFVFHFARDLFVGV